MPVEAMLPTFLVATLVTVAVPGPSVLFLVARSIEQGRWAGIHSMLGLETGALIHVGAAAVGLTAIVAAFAPARVAPLGWRCPRGPGGTSGTASSSTS
jgi:threonine/homoserine/homoserine lactone efflux protein